MSAWTCEQVEPLIDLYAADECDAPAGTAVERHLAACPGCRESCRQARQVLGLLDQRFQESERLQRLWARMDAERRRARRPKSPFVWRAAAIAAAVLLTFGLSGLLEPVAPVSPAWRFTARLSPPGERFAPGPMAVRDGFTSKAVGASPHAEMNAATVPAYPLDLRGKTPVEFRRELRTAGPDRLPPPPTVDLVLEIHNGGREVLPLRVGGEGTELTLELQGPGAISVPAPGAAPPVPELGGVRLAPGATLRLPIRRLAYGSRAAVRYAYWTEPGEYTLTITLRVPVQTNPLAAKQEAAATTGPIKIHVSGR